ncbi:MAG: choice-of-anchor J domain-containing protein [Bacteroidota bacterium]|nr:choice-of-anchor J domain-containing protein [Bacteroidota bacterium]
MKQFFTMFSLVLFAGGTVFSQEYFSENFENGSAMWQNVDNNNDNLMWEEISVGQAFNTDFYGAKSMISYSYKQGAPNNGVITPDNLLISPAVDLTSATGNVTLEFYIRTHLNYPADHLSVYVTTSNTPADILATTPLLQETVQEGGTNLRRRVDLSQFVGQTVYLTFRHHNCTDQFYVVLDNISVKNLPNNDVSVTSVDVKKYLLANQNNPLKLQVENLGANEVNALTINWNDGEDHVATIPLTIPSGGSAMIEHTIPLNYSVVNSYNAQITVEQVNGVADADPTNNQANVSYSVISQDGGAKVLIEEGTGTWCGWCPRGIVAMDYMYQNYADKFIGIAVHNNDPMAVSAYDSAAGFPGFPGMNIDREILGEGVARQLMEDYVNERSANPNPVKLEVNMVRNGNELTITPKATFYTNMTKEMRFAAIVVENGVKGTSSGYNQANFYAGGGNGLMGGFENLPQLVPAAQMVYDHVGRALIGGYDGQAGSIPDTVTDGQEVEYTFNYTIPSGFVPSKLDIVVLVIDTATGTVINANSASVASLNVNTFENAAAFTVYPNPAKDVVNFSLDFTGDLDVKLYNISGQEVLNQKVNAYQAQDVHSLPVSNLAKGVYFVRVEGNGQVATQKLIVE